MTRGWRGVVGTAVGLAMMQLVLRTSSNGGPAGALIDGVFRLPASWLRAFVDPTVPGLPAVEPPPSAPVNPSSALTGGLSGTPLPTGTGSNLVQI